MTDISKYKNVSLSKDTYTKIDKLRRIIVHFFGNSAKVDGLVTFSVPIKSGYGAVLRQITYVDIHLDSSASVEGSKTWFCTFHVLKWRKIRWKK